MQIFHIYRNENASNEVKVEEIKSELDVQLDALHHSCTQLSVQAPDDSTRVFMYGGRHSPCRSINAWPVILNIKQCGPEISVTVVKTIKSDRIPHPRWRHSAVCFRDDTKDHIAVFGGRTTDLKVIPSRTLC